VARRWWLAAAGVVLLAIIVAGVVLAAGSVLLPIHTPGTKAVPFTVLSRTGPIAGGTVEVLAATSIEDLLALTFAVSGSNASNCQAEKCWSSVTLVRPSLLIAASAPAPCRKSVLSADVGPGALLTIHEAVGAWECPIGARTLAVPSYWLLAVSLQDLPSKVVTVSADATDGAVGSTTADLRPPAPNQADHVTNVQELRSALYTAQRDADLRPGNPRKRLTGLALRRWPRSDLGCGSASSDADLAWGSLVVVGPYEYHELAGRTVLCGTTMMPTP
jgi:hypothetical protein